MADISKCSGKNCPLSTKCYRFTVKSNDLWQSYFTEPPYDKEKEKCEYFWEEKIKNK